MQFLEVDAGHVCEGEIMMMKCNCIPNFLAFLASLSEWKSKCVFST